MTSHLITADVSQYFHALLKSDKHDARDIRISYISHDELREFESRRITVMPIFCGHLRTVADGFARLDIDVRAS